MFRVFLISLSFLLHSPPFTALGLRTRAGSGRGESAGALVHEESACVHRLANPTVLKRSMPARGMRRLAVLLAAQALVPCAAADIVGGSGHLLADRGGVITENGQRFLRRREVVMQRGDEEFTQQLDLLPAARALAEAGNATLAFNGTVVANDTATTTQQNGTSETVAAPLVTDDRECLNDEHDDWLPHIGGLSCITHVAVIVFHFFLGWYLVGGILFCCGWCNLPSRDTETGDRVNKAFKHGVLFYCCPCMMAPVWACSGLICCAREVEECCQKTLKRDNTVYVTDRVLGINGEGLTQNQRTIARANRIRDLTHMFLRSPVLAPLAWALPVPPAALSEVELSRIPPAVAVHATTRGRRAEDGGGRRGVTEVRIIVTNGNQRDTPAVRTEPRPVTTV